MPERETQIDLNDRTVIGMEVPITDAGTERWSEFILEDGAIIRAKVNIISVIRVKDEYDAAGNPIYVINAAPVIGVVHTPTALRKKD